MAYRSPGPWQVVVRSELDGHGVMMPGGELVVRRGLGMGDANLISAAPELLEAARMLANLDSVGYNPIALKANGSG